MVFWPTPLAHLIRLPFWLSSRKPFAPPQKAVILQPGSISQVMLTTPLLAVLSHAFPAARFDWAVSEWARSAIVGNPRVTEIITIDHMQPSSWAQARQLASLLRSHRYDSCFIPHRSAWLGLAAWLAQIPQRVGLHVAQQGFAHTLAVRPPASEQHEAAIYLSLALAAGLDVQPDKVGLEFYPSDGDRTAVTKRLVDEIEWLGDTPLIILHPGGGNNPAATDELKRWPIERFVRLGNHLGRHYKARLLLVGAMQERPFTTAISGMMAHPCVNLAGQLTLGELGALCEVADLYVGNDTGPSHVAAAVGCPTIVIYGPSDPSVSRPFPVKGQVATVWREEEKRPFSWAHGVSVEEVIKTAEGILKKKG